MPLEAPGYNNGITRRELPPAMRGIIYQFPHKEGEPPSLQAFPFSEKQRRAIRARDGDTCQHPDGSIRHSDKLNVHHITPQRFAREVLHMPPEEIDTPENGITLCTNHHTGHPKSIHPDTQVALWKYHGGDSAAYKEMVEDREKKIKEGKIYWNNTHDGELRAKARKNSEAMDRKKGGRGKWWPI